MKMPFKNDDYLTFSFKNQHFQIFDFLKILVFRKSFFSMMKYYFLFGFFSVTKYVFLVTPETIQNTRRALTMTLDPQLDPNCWRKLIKFTRFSFCNKFLCAPPGIVNCLCQNLGLLVFKWTQLGAQEELVGQTIIGTY